MVVRLKCITFGAPVIGNSAFGLDMKELMKEFSWSPDFQSDFFINIIHHVCCAGLSINTNMS